MREVKEKSSTIFMQANLEKIRWGPRYSEYVWETVLLNPESKAGMPLDANNDIRSALLGREMLSSEEFRARSSYLFRDKPDLFLTFAQLGDVHKIDYGVIPDFANQYGFLGREISLAWRLSQEDYAVIKQAPWYPEIRRGSPPFPTYKEPPPGKLAQAERLDIWSEAIRTMHRAVAVWECLLSRDQQRLSQWIKWDETDGTPAVYYIKGSWPSLQATEAEWGYKMIASQKTHPNRFLWLKEGDIEKPAQFFLQDCINRQLGSETKGVGMSVEWNEVKSDLHFEVHPASLQSALWLQFARAVVSDDAYPGRCAHCNKLYLISPSLGAYRTNKKYCSNSCKTLADRLKHTVNPPRPRGRPRKHTV